MGGEGGGGRGEVSNNQEYLRKRGVSIKRTCAYEGEGGDQILANIERTY